VIDVRDTAAEIRALASSLHDDPSSSSVRRRPVAWFHDEPVRRARVLAMLCSVQDRRGTSASAVRSGSAPALEATRAIARTPRSVSRARARHPRSTAPRLPSCVPASRSITTPACWVEPVPAMLQQLLVQTLASSGAYATVVSVPSRVNINVARCRAAALRGRGRRRKSAPRVYVQMQ
jgi:hypothetical protein